MSQGHLLPLSPMPNGHLCAHIGAGASSRSPGTMGELEEQQEGTLESHESFPRNRAADWERRTEARPRSPGWTLGQSAKKDEAQLREQLGCRVGREI